ncbi:MAG TPA: beta-ketoacyl synthase N-terminal-like domain-containing protein [Streptosporangiaceae bacterium]|nr:beta-ketoacyl synthase N-terminal-like domain-containing protein [Streptosporangiaceae bacterium]
MTETAALTPPTSLAVVGLACRFPDADDPPALLDVVLTGRRAFRRVPPGRLNLADYYRSDPATSDATYSTRAAVIDGWRFDRAAFGVDPTIYYASDPAHWLALETAARALAAAGLPAGAGLDRDRTGVIIGNTLAGDSSRANALRVRWPYVRRTLGEALDGANIPPSQVRTVLRRAERRFLAPFPAIGPDSLAGSMPATIAATISAYFGFRGGSHAVDSASSSSLQAVASACSALAAGEIDAAIAGGVDLSLDPLELIGLAKAGVLATSDVRLYDRNPSGYLPGEGCGVVVLLRTADARAAGLPVHAEILGWGTSSGGLPGQPRSQASSQLLAMRRAYDRAGVDPAEIHYLEGNGAATPADDEAELAALAAIRAGARHAAALGSVKANIGHAQAAAGAAGLIKTVLAVNTGVVPPATGVAEPHSLITDGDARLHLPLAAQDWARGSRLAAVSATGIGGSNVHLVLRHEASRSRGHRDRVAPAAPVGVQRAPNGAPAPRAFLLHAHDRAGLATTLSRLADRAAWLSDSEMLDLACALGRDPAAQGPARVALVATRQEQLAALAREALGVLPGLTEGRIMARPGIFASDGADGRLLLLMSGEHPAGVAIGPDATLGHCLDMLRWLDTLEVAATTAVGHGFGLLAGLAWAGVLGQGEVTEIAELRTRFLAKSAAQGAATMMIDAVAADWPPDDDADAAALRAAIAQRFRLGPPRRRLLSTVTGAEVRSVDEAVDLICRGFAGADRMTDAVAHGALGATLLLDTGPGQALANAAAAVRVPALSLRPGLADPLNTARVAAALFAAGALGAPQPLFATQQARPINIWREPVFLTSPCEPAPRPRRARRVGDGPPPEDAVATTPMAAASARPAARLTGAGSAADALRRALEAAARPAVSPATVNGTARTLLNGSARTSAGGTARTSANGAAPTADATEASAAHIPDLPVDTGATSSDGYLPGGAGVPASQAHSVAGLAAWSRCFAEALRPVSRPPAPESSRAWRVFAAARSPRLADLGGQFAADPAAPRTLAVLEDPADPQSRSTAVAAARDAVSTGELVVVTASPGFTGFFATLHAEQPSVGITVLRVPSEALTAAVLLPFASAAPGQFRELVFAATGAASEPVLTEVPLPGGADFPLGPDDVLVISRATGGAGLALARVLACSGTGIAMIGRADGHDDTELIAGLEELRSAGARIGYEIVDVADRASLISAIRRIEGRLGAVTAIAHAATQDHPVPVLSISDPDARSRPAAEAGVLEALAGSVAAGQLKLIISIGTVAGRYGLAGAGLHALGCGAVASSAAELAAARTGCAALHLDLPAWRTGGLGERPGLAEQLAAADTPALDIGAASRLLLRLMTTPALPRRLALHGRIGGLASRRPPVITAAELAVAGLPRGGRFLREVAVHYQGIELICTARLSLATDPYLADYQIDGIPVLPPVLALEALAQAASVLAGRPVRQANAVTLESPVLIHPDGEATVRICAQRAGDTIATALRSSGSSYRVDHATAEFSCTAPELAEAVAPASGLPQLAAAATGLVDGTELYGQVCFQSGRFRRIALLPEVTARSGRAIARGADDQPWFAPGSELADTDLLLGSPGLHDAALQLLQACQPHRRVRPTGCESVHFSGRAESGPVEIRAVAEPVRVAVPPGPDSVAAGADGAAGWTPVVPGQPGAPGAEHDDGAGLVGGLGDVAGPAAADAASLLADGPADRARELPARSRHARRWRAEGGRQHAAGVGADQGIPGAAPAGPGPAGSRGARERRSGEQLWSVEAVNAAGQLLASWRGVRLRDTGPLPRTAAWPPALLAVFLERGATDLGLDVGLRVTVSCGQPELPSDVIPRQPGSAEVEPPDGDGTATSDGEQRPRRRLLSIGRAAELGPLGGYTMTVRAPVPAACGWVTVDEDGRQHQPATGLAIAYGQLRAELDEPPAVLAGRLEAIRACLTAVGLHGEADLRVVHSAGARWVLLATRRARIACTVVELSGVAAPVAVALLTVRTHARTADARPAAAVLT